MVDAPACGAGFPCVETFGADVMNADPERSVIFSMHYYCPAWGANNATTIGGYMSFAKSHGWALVTGEFSGADSSGAGCADDSLPVATLAQGAQQGIGWYWFDWVTGNWAAAKSYSAVSEADLTTNGHWLIYDNADGVKATSKKASVFTGAQSSCGAVDTDGGGSAGAGGGGNVGGGAVADGGPGLGGNAASGGAAGVGGVGAAAGGADGASSGPEGDESGCACATAAPAHASGLGWLGAWIALIALRRRRA
jgi:MYXO-CTERM domain-containing protein